MAIALKIIGKHHRKIILMDAAYNVLRYKRQIADKGERGEEKEEEEEKGQKYELVE